MLGFPDQLGDDGGYYDALSVDWKSLSRHRAGCFVQATTAAVGRPFLLVLARSGVVRREQLDRWSWSFSDPVLSVGTPPAASAFSSTDLGVWLGRFSALRRWTRHWRRASELVEV